MHAPVTPSTGRDDVGRRRASASLEAVAVVEPLRGAEVAVASPPTGSAVGVQQLRPPMRCRPCGRRRTAARSSQPAARPRRSSAPRRRRPARPARCRGCSSRRSRALASRASARAPLQARAGALVLGRASRRRRPRSRPVRLVVLRTLATACSTERGIAERRDHDRHRAAVLAVPAPRPRLLAAVAAAVPEPAPERRGPQREGDDAERELLRAVVPQRQPPAAPAGRRACPARTGAEVDRDRVLIVAGTGSKDDRGRSSESSAAHARRAAGRRASPARRRGSARSSAAASASASRASVPRRQPCGRAARASRAPSSAAQPAPAHARLHPSVHLAQAAPLVEDAPQLRDAARTSCECTTAASGTYAFAKPAAQHVDGQQPGPPRRAPRGTGPAPTPRGRRSRWRP